MLNNFFMIEMYVLGVNYTLDKPRAMGKNLIQN